MAIPDKQTLTKLYWQKKMSMPEIGKKYHVHYITVRNWLIKHKISRRKKGERTDSWKEKEIQILKNYRGIPIEKLLRLLPHRTNQAIYDKLKNLGYSRFLEKFRLAARRTLNLRKEEWSYLAGIIDGEGMVTIERQRRSNSFHPKLAVTTTNRNLSDWLQKRVNATCVISQNNHPTWKTKYECFLHGYNCKPVLENILPFLKIKQRHAKLAMEFIELRLSRKLAGMHYSKEKEIYSKIRRLNSSKAQLRSLGYM